MKKIKSENVVKVEAMCVLTHDTLWTAMTEDISLIRHYRYKATYEYIYNGEYYYKDIVFKGEKVNGIQAKQHPYKIMVAFDKKRPRKAIWLKDKLVK